MKLRVATLVEYDPRLGLASFQSPKGFTQIQMSEDEARAIAEVFGVEFRMWDRR